MLGRITTLFALILLVATALFAQQPTKPSAFDQWRASRINIYMNDFAELQRYHDANTALLAAAPVPNRADSLPVARSRTKDWSILM